MIYRKKSWLPYPAEQVYDWHLCPGAFERLNPPWNPAQVVRGVFPLVEGSRVQLKVPIGPCRWNWTAEHRGFIPGREFQDIQIRGPFAQWEHTHRIIPDQAGCWLEDEIQIQPPGGILMAWTNGMARQGLDQVFDYRHRITASDLGIHMKGPQRKMNILISGSTGLVGTELVPFLTTGGHQVTRLARKPKGPNDIAWDPIQGNISSSLEGFDAVVHLAGEGIANKRWSKVQKAKIRSSRVEGTKNLCHALARLERKPKTLVCASAIGYYGDRGEEELDEKSAPGTGFLAEVCQEWEAACAPAVEAGISVVNLRFGVILSPKGGALKQMLFPFRMGAGGRLGGGRQYMSWISIDDVLGIIHFSITKPEIAQHQGQSAINVVSPQPMKNSEFTKVLARVLYRPAFFPVPSFMLRLALGEMADALLLASCRIYPRALESAGYPFLYPDLELALRHLLGKTSSKN